MAETIPEMMQAAVYRAVDEVRTETIAVPAIGAGEVLVRIDTCGICGTDLKKIHTGSHSAPRVFGHEMAGTVAAVGEGVSGFAVGDRVMAFHHIPCGECFYCRKKTFAQCETYKQVGTTAGLGEAAGGGFAEYIRVMDWIVGDGVTPAGLIHVPDDIPLEQAAFIEPVNTCFKAVKLLGLEPDETVLVIGQGVDWDYPGGAGGADGGDGVDVGYVSGAACDCGGVWVDASAGCAGGCGGGLQGGDGRAWGGCGVGGCGGGCVDCDGDGGDSTGRSGDVVCEHAAWDGGVRSGGGVHG